MPISAGFGTILAERLVDAMMLVIVLAGSVLVVFGTEMPSQARPTLLLGALLIVAGLCGLAVLWFTRDSVVRFLPGRIQEAYAGCKGRSSARCGARRWCSASSAALAQ